MATIQRTSSPVNISDKTGNNSNVSRKKGYSDLDLKLTKHPFRKDITPLRDDAAVKNAVKNLILTNFFERPFQPDLGSNLRALLFEPADSITELAMEDNIKKVLIKEPRIKVYGVSVVDKPNDNSYTVTIKFKIKQIDLQTQVSVVLRRLR